jgi:hypothetical protein
MGLSLYPTNHILNLTLKSTVCECSVGRTQELFSLMLPKLQPSQIFIQLHNKLCNTTTEYCWARSDYQSLMWSISTASVSVGHDRMVLGHHSRPYGLAIHKNERNQQEMSLLDPMLFCDIVLFFFCSNHHYCCKSCLTCDCEST